jgi:hypothetical protein
LKNKKIFVAVTNDISTDYRVHKICNYLISKKYDVVVYGRILSNTINVKRDYKIIRKKHIFNHNFLFYAEFNIRLFFYLIFRKFDYILSNDLDTLPACFFASKIKITELVYDSHELFSEGPELQGRKFVQGFWRALEDFFLPKVKKAYTVSQSIVEFYDDKYQNKMGLIRNIPLKKDVLELEEVAFPTTNKTILYQGVLNPGRGLKPMIKALKFIDDLDLIVIGYGKVEEELKTRGIFYQRQNSKSVSDRLLLAINSWTRLSRNKYITLEGAKADIYDTRKAISDFVKPSETSVAITVANTPKKEKAVD